jgi:hypothetical protein
LIHDVPNQQQGNQKDAQIRTLPQKKPASFQSSQSYRDRYTSASAELLEYPGVSSSRIHHLGKTKVLGTSRQE